MAGFTKAQLQTEINGDPKALGYAALKAAPNAYVTLRDKLNATYGGVGVVWRTDLSAREVLCCIAWADISAFTAAQSILLSLLLIPGSIDASNSNVQAQFAGLFGPATATRAALLLAGKKANPSRAEELWGYNAVVSEQDVANAINP